MYSKHFNIKDMEKIELNEYGKAVWKHKTNHRLFLEQSYRWVDRLTLIDETEGRQIIDSYKASTYDYSAWTPMTVTEYNSVVYKYCEIYGILNEISDSILKPEIHRIGMSNKEILEGNRLIADFMGVKITGTKYGCNHQLVTCAYPNYSNLKYHSSWDWLMPVVERIENLESGKWYIHIQGNTIDIEDGNEGIGLWDFHINNDDPIMSAYPNDKNLKPIQALWLACVEFVNWYNNQKDLNNK